MPRRSRREGKARAWPGLFAVWPLGSRAILPSSGVALRHYAREIRKTPARGSIRWGPGFSDTIMLQPGGWFAAVAQLVRAPDCGSGGRWFESTQLYQRVFASLRFSMEHDLFGNPAATLNQSRGQAFPDRALRESPSRRRFRGGVYLTRRIALPTLAGNEKQEMAGFVARRGRNAESSAVWCRAAALALVFVAALSPAPAPTINIRPTRSP